jgi:hypothetical protein
MIEEARIQERCYGARYAGQVQRRSNEAGWIQRGVQTSLWTILG